MKRQLIGGIVAVALSASTVTAQQPNTPRGDRSPAMAGGNAMPMVMMDSLDHRLDSLLARMNAAAGNEKVRAMAAVINEMAAQRKAMQSLMRQMMGGGGMMMMMNESTSARQKPTTRADSAAGDTTNHEAHHPPQ